MSDDRLFIGAFPCGIVYADRRRNYETVAFLPYATLEIEWSAACAAYLRAQIEAHAATLVCRRGEQFEISTTGQTVTLGGA